MKPSQAPVIGERLVFALAGSQSFPDDVNTWLGVEWAQTNITDDAVSGALALPYHQPAFDAFVSVPGTASAEEILAKLARRAEAVLGWRCEVREPLKAPERTALANVAVLRKPESLDYAEWHAHWYGAHTDIACATQGTFGYVQNRVLQALTPQSQGVHAIVEELFPLEACHDIHAFYGSGGDDAELSRRMTDLMASVARLGADQNLDLVPTTRRTWG